MENGEDPAVVDAADLTGDPEGTIRAYCEKLGVEFMPEALSWRRVKCRAGRCGQSGTRKRRRATGIKSQPLEDDTRCRQAWKASTSTVFHTTRSYTKSG